MTDTELNAPTWTIRFSKWARFLGVAALAIAISGALLARWEFLPKLWGAGAIALGALVAVIGTLFGLLGVIQNLRFKSGTLGIALVGLILSGGFAGVMGSRILGNPDKAGLHDVSTDLANPPTFQKLSLRPDNLAGVETEAKWRERHAAAYGDIKTVMIAKPVATVISDAEKNAKARGWDIALADPASGRLEATDCVSLICYRDDVVLRVAATEGGKGSRVDMRSVSRVGQGDLGVNAKRVRAFLAELQK